MWKWLIPDFKELYLLKGFAAWLIRWVSAPLEHTDSGFPVLSHKLLQSLPVYLCPPKPMAQGFLPLQFPLLMCRNTLWGVFHTKQNLYYKCWLFMFEYKWNIVKCVLYFGLPLNEEGRLQIRRGICLLVIWMFWRGEGGGVSSIHVKKLFFFETFSYDTGLHWKAKGRNPRCSNCGVWLGIHFAYSYHSQHDAWRTSREVWETEHRGPDHVNQWDQFGWFTTLDMSEHYKGMEDVSGITHFKNVT